MYCIISQLCETCSFAFFICCLKQLYKTFKAKSLEELSPNKDIKFKNRCVFSACLWSIHLFQKKQVHKLQQFQARNRLLLKWSVGDNYKLQVPMLNNNKVDWQYL